MEPPDSTWTCKDWHVGFNFSGEPADARCPDCESKSPARTLVVRDEMQLRPAEHVTLKAKDRTYPSSKNPRREIRSGQRPDASGRAVDEWRLIDKNVDRYEERIADPETGKILHRDEGRLSEHRGHGSAKPAGKRKDDV